MKKAFRPVYNSHLKRIVGLLLAVAMLLSLLPVLGLTAFAEKDVVLKESFAKKADPVSANVANEADGLPVTTAYNGRIWTDKSVSSGSISFKNYAGESPITVNTADDEFSVALSALAQAYEEINLLGEEGEVTVNVALVIDTSSSMDNNYMTNNGTQVSRMKLMREAGIKFLQQLRTYAEEGKIVNLSVMSYCGDGTMVLDWTNINENTYATAEAAIAGLKKTNVGNTNCEAGLALARWLYDEGYDTSLARADLRDPQLDSTKNYVLFMTDGAPNRSYKDEADGAGFKGVEGNYLFNSSQRVTGTTHSDSVITSTITATDYIKRAAHETLVQCKKLHELTLPSGESNQPKLNNLTFMCVGFGEWFTGDQYDTAFPTAVNLLSLCSAVGNGNAYYTGDVAQTGLESYSVYPYDVRGNMNPVAAVTLGNNIPYYTMYGNNPAYPDFTYNNYANWKSGSSYSFANEKGVKTTFKDVNTTKSKVTIYGQSYTVTLKEAVDLLDRYDYAERGYASALDYRKGNGITEISAQLRYAGQYMFGATNAADLTNAFDSMAKIIYNAYNMVNYNVIETEGSVHIPELKAALQMTDEIGRFMQVGDFKALVYQDQLYDGSAFAQTFTPIAMALAEGRELTHGQNSNLEIYQVMLQNNFCEGTGSFPLTAVKQILVGAYRSGDLYYNSDSDFGCRLCWYATPGKEENTYIYVTPYYDFNGKKITAEGTTDFVTELYGMYGTVNDSTDSSQMRTTNLMYLCIGYTKNLISKQQTVLFYVPSSMVPVRLLNRDRDTGIATINAHNSSDPIHLVYTVRMLTDINYNDDEYVLYCQNPQNRNYDAQGNWDGTVNFYTNNWVDNKTSTIGVPATVSADGMSVTDNAGNIFQAFTYAGAPLEMTDGSLVVTDGTDVYMVRGGSMYLVEKEYNYGGDAKFTPLDSNPYYRSQYDILLMYRVVQDSDGQCYIAVPSGLSTLYYPVELLPVVLKYLDLYGQEVATDYYYANEMTAAQGTPAGLTELGFYPAMFNPTQQGIPAGAYYCYTWFDESGEHSEYRLVSGDYDCSVNQVFYSYSPSSGVNSYLTPITNADGSYATTEDGGYQLQGSNIYSYRDGQIFTSGSGMTGQIAIGYLPRDTHMLSERLGSVRMKSENTTETLDAYYKTDSTFKEDGSILEHTSLGNNGKLAVKTAAITVRKNWRYSDGNEYVPGEGSYITLQLFATAIDPAVQNIMEIPEENLQAVSDQVELYYDPDSVDGWGSYTWRFAQATVDGVEMRQYIVKEISYHLVTEDGGEPEAVFEPSYVVPTFDSQNLLYTPATITNITKKTYTQDASVVLDYGLPVQTHPISGQALPAGCTIRAITDEPVALSYDNGTAVGSFTTTPTITDGCEVGQTLTMLYGTAEITDGDVVTYTPNTMQMTGKDVLYYEAVAQNYYGNDYYFTGKLTLIPATVMYYEENFGGITFDAPAGSNAQWNTIGEDIATIQDEDRPGSLDENDADNPYGYDSHYEFYNRYSGGSAMATTVNGNGSRYATASFVVTGTAFDIIATTKVDTGLARVDIYNMDGSRVKAIAVDTYYGYTYTPEEQIRLGVDGNVMYQQAYNEQTGYTEYVLDENGAKIPMTTHWVVDLSATGGLYQIPVIKYQFPQYGQYRIVLTVAYSTRSDNRYDSSLPIDENAYDFELDAIRVYNSAGYESANLDSDILSAYLMDDEYRPVETKVRDQLIANNGFGEEILEETILQKQDAKKKTTKVTYEDDFIAETMMLLAMQEKEEVSPKRLSVPKGSNIPGFVFIDGVGNEYVVDKEDFDDFKKYGPKNEVYLSNSQAVAFVMTAEEIPADVQISVKTILGGETRATDKSVVTFASVDGNGSPTRYARTVDTASEQYVSIGDILTWVPSDEGGFETAGPIVFTSTGASIVSITNIKSTTAVAMRNTSIRALYSEQVVQTAGELVNLASANEGCEFGAWDQYKAPTCSETGMKERSCIWCGKVEVETVPVLGHAYEVTTSALTCEQDSISTYLCTVCGDSFTETSAQAKGHDWQTLSTLPTCTAAGYHVMTCLDCGLRVIEDLPQLEHQYENGICTLCERTGTLTDSIQWSIADGVLTISGKGSIPEYTNQNKIPWYSRSAELQGLVIEEGITGIGRLAFYRCAFTSVSLPQSLRAIGAYAFSTCTKLTELVLPDQTMAIGKNAFVACTSLEKITIPESTVTICENILLSCRKCTVYGYENSAAQSFCEKNNINFVAIGTVTAPPVEELPEQDVPQTCEHSFANSVCTACGLIGGTCGSELNWTFVKEEGLLSITGQGSMDNYTAGKAPWFAYRGSIKKVVLGTGVTSIGKLAFYACSLKDIEVASTVTEVGGFAFSTCILLTKVDLPAAVGKIGDNTFVGCSKLESVSIRNSAATFGRRVFLRCNVITLQGEAGSTTQAFAQAENLNFEILR